MVPVKSPNSPDAKSSISKCREARRCCVHSSSSKMKARNKKILLSQPCKPNSNTRENAKQANKANMADKIKCKFLSPPNHISIACICSSPTPIDLQILSVTSTVQ